MTITTLTDNPGLYPLNLGNALVKASDWTLFKTIDYTPLISNYKIIRLSILRTIGLLKDQNFSFNNQHADNSKHIIMNHNNQLSILNQYVSKTDKLIDQLFPHNNIRIKRGLIDGVGHIFKFLTGNLDSTDGKRYDQLIEKLIKSDQNQNDILMEQAHVLNDTLSTVIDLGKSQELLNNNLNKIILNNKKIQETLATLSIGNALNEAIQSMQLLIDYWMELETSITFAQNYQLHISIIDNQELLEQLKEISKSLSLTSTHGHKLFKLPYEVNVNNLRLYESIITIKAYQKENVITFVLEIPLISQDIEYQLNQLIPFPIYISQDQFRMIVPTYLTILFNKLFSIPINIDNCKSISINNYFCSPTNKIEIPSDKLCETQLLNFNENQTCRPLLFKLTSTKITQIDSNTWLIGTPKKLIADIKCSQISYRKEILGSQIIHITPDCNVIINNENVLFYMKSSITKSIDLKLPHINRLQVAQEEHVTITKLDLSVIDTKKLINNQLKLSKHVETLNKNNMSYTPYFSIIPIIILLIVTVIIIIVLCYMFKKRSSFFKKMLDKYSPTISNIELIQSN